MNLMPTPLLVGLLIASACGGSLPAPVPPMPEPVADPLAKPVTEPVTEPVADPTAPRELSSTGAETRTVKVGASFTINLESNPTTGYGWAVKAAPDAKIVKLADQYTPARHAAGITGSGGTHAWTFTGVGAGTVTVVLGYAQPWVKDVAPAFTHTVTVTVN